MNWIIIAAVVILLFFFVFPRLGGSKEIRQIQNEANRIGFSAFIRYFLESGQKEWDCSVDPIAGGIRILIKNLMYDIGRDFGQDFGPKYKEVWIKRINGEQSRSALQELVKELKYLPTLDL